MDNEFDEENETENLSPAGGASISSQGGKTNSIPFMDPDLSDSVELINTQRSNLIALLDLLNETLENNASPTSPRASDLHMISLLNINKIILNGNESGDSYSSKADQRSQALKKTLLDSLAEPFYERTIVEESLIESEEATREEVDDFVGSDDAVALGDMRPQQDYGRILRTFTSTKNSAPQAIFTCTLTNPWKFKAANDLACLLFGISKNALKALTLLDLIHTDSRPFVLHKILSTEGQELVFAGEIIGIIQPGANSNSSGLIWASFWAKRKNGLLVCVFERVPCDYVDVLLNSSDFSVENIVKKSGLLDETDLKNTNSTQTINHNETHPKFELGVFDDKDEDDDDSEDEDSIAPKQKEATKTVKFANDVRDLGQISQSLKQLIEDVCDGKLTSPDDDLLPLSLRAVSYTHLDVYKRQL